MRSLLRRLATGALGVRAVNRAARRVAAARGRSLVLVYHRVAPDGSGPSPLVPSIPETLFARQLQTLGELGEIVPLAELLGSPHRAGRCRFALTFDDDYRAHAESVLPLLGRLGVHGTFFLSGRSLHGLGPYWFEVLERLVEQRGVHEVAGRLALSGRSPAELAVACERDPRRQRQLEEAAEQPPEHLWPDQLRTLAATMTVGFHTLHHPALPALSYEAVARAVTEGRAELAAVIRRPLSLFAYPHGKADRRVAAQVRRAGYTAAWTGTPDAIRPGDDPFLLGRWEPGPVTVDDLVVKVAARLHRPRTAPVARA